MRRIDWVARAVIGVLVLVSAPGTAAHGGATGKVFITARDGKLYEGEQEFRFISFNIPNLHYVEDDLAFARTMPFRWPDEYEIADALESIRQLGGRVVRIYALSVRKSDDPADMPRHVLRPGQFDEQGFRTLDLMLEIARQKGIRVVVPFVDNWKWWGGVPQYAAFRDLPEQAFWSDPRLIADFKQTIEHVITRINTRTGVAYRDDPTILAWETGNELHCPPEWTRQIAAYIKQLDATHLVLDGRHESVLQIASLDDPSVDIVQTHHYEKDPRQMIEHIRRSAALARGGKPYLVGEFGFICTEAMLAVMDTIIEQGACGGLAWSLRYHHRDGGFFWHHEPAGGDLFKAYHWPGFASGEAYDETRMLALMREKAFAIQGRQPPPLPLPAAPKLLDVTAGGQLRWQGAAGATGYDIERADAAGGSWRIVEYNVSDAAVQYRPLFVDARAVPGREYRYRVLARNAAGRSEPSNVCGPVTITHRTLVDELWNEGRMFFKSGKLTFQVNEARKFKEDAHRLAGEPGAKVVYRVPDPLAGARLFTFAAQDGEHFRISVSSDGQTFTAWSPIKTVIDVLDAATYGFWTPIRYDLAKLPADTRYVQIEFLSDAQLSRVELAYGSEE